MQLRSKLLSLTALAMLVTAFGSSALTLGRVRGAAIIGRALDVSIPVQLDGDETAANLCIEADVFHSDTKVEPGRVRVSVEQAQGAQTANVRVLSSAFVDEPVVFPPIPSFGSAGM